MNVKLARVYDDTERQTDEYRVLVDRLWPRGISKADADLDEWLKDAAPSTDLRRWYGHDVSRFAEFANRYGDEMRHPPASDALERLAELASGHELVLLTATRDVEHSGARVLHEHLEALRKRKR